MTLSWPTSGATNVTKYVYAVSGDNEEQEAVDEVVQETTASDNGEVAPESYKQAVLDPEWRKSMMSEVKALRNRGCWRVVPTPSGVRLIKSKYVYKLKKDWRGVVTKRKSRLVCQGFLQREGIDFNETYAPVAKGTTFKLMLPMTKAYNLHLHQLDVDSAFLYADLDKRCVPDTTRWHGDTRGILSEAAEESLRTEAGAQKLEQEYRGAHQVTRIQAICR